MVFPEWQKLHFYRFQDNKEFVIWAKNLSWLSDDLSHSSLGHESVNDVKGMYFRSLREHLNEVWEHRKKYV